MREEPLEALVARRDRAGLFLDFDGTLSQIVPVPSDARPLPGVVDALKELALSFRLVTVVSGRSAEQLLDWLGPEVEISGTYGAERTVDGRVELSDKTAPFADLMRAVKEQAEEALAELDLEGVSLEDKRVVISLHYRRASDPSAAERLKSLADELATRHGLIRREGRRVVELHPPVELSKKAVVLERAREAQLEAAAFAGDDRGDLGAFDALDELAREGVTTVRVGVRSDETPPELLARAQVVVDGPEGVRDLLASLI